MLPHMTEIYDELTSRLLPARPGRPDRIFFFDLADPEKRSPADLAAALQAIARFAPFGRATLGLNLKEAQQVLAALALGPEPETPEGFRAAAAKIRVRLDLATVVVHPKESAACATREGSWWLQGPYTPETPPSAPAAATTSTPASPPASSSASTPRPASSSASPRAATTSARAEAPPPPT